VILVDVHPAELQMPDGTRHERVRAVLTHQRIRVWTEVGRTPQLLVDEAHDGVQLEARHPLIGRPIEIPTSAGVLSVTRMRGCGCGSSLKALRPPRDDD
jgi:hypothetical protein